MVPVSVYDQILNHEDEFCIDYSQNLVESSNRNKKELDLAVAFLSASYCQAQFQLASSVPVQLGTEICLIISVTPTPPSPPTQPGRYI